MNILEPFSVMLSTGTLNVYVPLSLIAISGRTTAGSCAGFLAIRSALTSLNTAKASRDARTSTSSVNMYAL